MSIEEPTPATNSPTVLPAERPMGPSVDGHHEQELQQVRDALKGIRFGTVQIIIQDGVIVQIDRTEKRRLRRSGNVSTEKCR